MSETNTDSKSEPKERPVISHFGGRPIHPKTKKETSPAKTSTEKKTKPESEQKKPAASTKPAKRSNAQTAKAKLNDPDFAGKKAVKKPAKTPQKDIKPQILEKTEVKPVEKSTKIVEKPVENYVEKSNGSEKPIETKKSRRHTLPAIVRVPFAIMLLVGTSLLFNWYTFLRQYNWDFERVGDFMNSYAGQYYLSWGIIFFAMSLIAALTWKVFFTVGASFSLLSILTFVNSEKMAMRDAPFLPDDMIMVGNIGQVASYVDQDKIVRLVAGVILVLAGAILMEIFAKKAFGRDSKKLPWWERHALIPRATFGMMAIAGLSTMAAPLMRQEAVSWVQKMELVGWNQTANYAQNGLIVGFVNNLGKLEIPQPDNYSKETMAEIAERYENRKAEDKTARKPLTEVADRVIVILDETFYDPELLTKYYPHSGGDVLPNLHKLFQNYPSGYMYSPEYGGNTANVEFEVQTGLSNYWASTMPYVTTVTKTDGLTSIASIALGLGYETTAIHSYDGTMYKRNLVYPLLGYNTFISRDEMRHDDKEPGPNTTILNDRAAFLEVLDVLDEGPERQMVSVVTMQNHGPYWVAVYPKWEFQMINAYPDGDGNGDYSRNNNYQSLHEADKYVAEFLAELKKSSERTVVLWFGDHAAGLFEKYTESKDKVDRDTIHLTPYFIWTNFEVKNTYTAAKIREQNTELGITIPATIKGVDLPTTTPNCLQNTMYNLLGIEKPAFFYLLDEVCMTTPILAHSYLEENGPATTQAMTDYELVNYDAMAGKQYWKYE